MRKYRYLLLFAAKLVVLTGVAWADTPLPDADSHLQYVNGSWVNIRQLPAANASVIDHVVINTPVRVEANTTVNDFCGITYDDGKHGYIACRLLGDKPVTLQEIGVPYDDNGLNPSYSYTRAFWIQPSVDHLLAVGKYYESTMLKAGELKAEQLSVLKSGQIMDVQRPHIPEYEAMKSRLQNGVMGVLDEDYHPFTTWQEIKKNEDHIYFYGSGFTDDNHEDYRELLRIVDLPPVKQSYFRNFKEVIPPGTTAEKVSALLTIPYKTHVTGGSKWWPPDDQGDDNAKLHGAWDIGVIETRLASPVLRHTILRDGTVSTIETDIPISRDPFNDFESCREGFALGDAGDTIQEPVNPGPKLFYFFSKSKLPYSKANVTHEKHKLSIATFIEAETIHFDIDHDGIDDILAWEGTGISKGRLFASDIPEAYFRMFFINMNGSWYLFKTDDYIYACTC